MPTIVRDDFLNPEDILMPTIIRDNLTSGTSWRQKP